MHVCNLLTYYVTYVTLLLIKYDINKYPFLHRLFSLIYGCEEALLRL